MMSYTISRWRLRWLNTSYGFVLVDVTDFERSICTREANFMEIGPPAAKIMISSILKMAAAVAQYYFRFRISWRYSLLKVKSCPQTKFGRHTLTHGCWKNKRPPYWNYTSDFDLDHFAVIGVSFCIRLPNFLQIGTSAAEIWRHIDFQDGRRQPCCICFGVMTDHPRSAFRGLNSVLKSLDRRITNNTYFWRYCDV